MKRLRIVLGNSELNRLYNRETILVRTPQGEEMEIVLNCGAPFKRVEKPSSYLETLLDNLLNLKEKL